MSSTRRNFLVTLTSQFNPKFSNTDIQDVAEALHLPLPTAESIARELEDAGLIVKVGTGGNIAPTAAGARATADPNWS